MMGERRVGEGGVHLDAASVTLSLRELYRSQCALTGPIANCSGAIVVVFYASLRLRTSVLELRRATAGSNMTSNSWPPARLMGGPALTAPINNLSIGHEYTHLLYG